jgi:hypothetical protein
VTVADIAPAEFLYGIDSSVNDDSRYYEPPRIVRFRITKKTPKRIYYVRRDDGLRTETGYVNRQQIEADGEIYNHGAGGWWAPDFHLYLTPPVIEQARKPNLAELKSAMAAAHPDRGGSDEAFIAARARYEKARRTA